MPYGDRTGPNGQGALTGRGLGVCNNSNEQNVGFGRGRGRGNRNLNRSMRSNALSLEEEKSMLTARLDEINQQLKK